VITVVVPVRGEEPPEDAFLGRLAGAEVLVAAEGGLTPAARAAWEAAGARVFASDAPRGARLREAARESTRDVLLFLHADTLLPPAWSADVARAIAGGAVSGAFRLAFRGRDPRLSWVAFWANLRTRVTRVPYGDQAPFVRRDVYERLDGHRSWPLLEDVELSRRVKREGPVALLPAAVLTSPRRYLARGVAKTVLTNWRILHRWRRGASPETLAADYRRG
jgi:rSAM/selenodomain-associated transferase 2